MAVVKSFVFEASGSGRLAPLAQSVRPLSASTTKSPLALPPPDFRRPFMRSQAGPAWALEASRRAAAQAARSRIESRFIFAFNT